MASTGPTQSATSATEGSATEPLPTPLETAQGASNGLLTESAFATEMSPSAKITEIMHFKKEGLVDTSSPEKVAESIEGFQAAQEAKNQEYLAKVEADKKDRINYADPESWEGTNFLGNADSKTAYNFDVTNERTLGQTEAFNPSSDAYSTLIAAEEESKKA